MDVLVAGGTGCLGRALCRELAERGHGVTAMARSPDAVALPRGVETVAADVTDPDLTGVVDGHDAVVNLVALPSHVSPRGTDHEAVHRDGTAALVAASEATGAERFVQLSALGVDSDVDTAYFRAKRGAERVVRESVLDWTVLRPSVVFGEGCAFFPFLRRFFALGVAPLPGRGRIRLQPIWVGDLAPMLADCVTDPAHAGRTYRLGGPEVLTLAAVIERVCGDPVVVPLPDTLAAALFALADPVPFVPFDLDQYRVFALDNTVAENDAVAFGVDPASLRTVRQYLSGEV
jgi:NADH dehydrogenase